MLVGCLVAQVHRGMSLVESMEQPQDQVRQELVWKRQCMVGVSVERRSSEGKFGGGRRSTPAPALAEVVGL